MSALFLAAVNRSIAAGWAILAVCLLRLPLRRVPRWIPVLLWGIVAVRLVCPLTPESVLSLIPSAETVSPGILTGAVPPLQSGFPLLDTAAAYAVSGTLSPGPASAPLQTGMAAAAAIWLIGAAALLLYAAVSTLRLKQKVRTAVRLRDNLFQSEQVTSPFVLGLFRPRIYVPFGMEEATLRHVTVHEQAHIRRRDPLWKFLGFLLLAAYWFQPLLWLAYALFGRDLELACDERAVRGMTAAQRAEYSEALLSCSIRRHRIAACPLAFGESGVKRRVQSVLRYKKPALWVLLAALAVSAAAAVCLLTDPIRKADTAPAQSGDSELQGLSLQVLLSEASDNGPRLLVQYQNRTPHSLVYGAPFCLYREENGQWVDCSIEPNPVWIAIAYTLPPGAAAERRYNLSGQKLKVSCVYRLEVEFFVKSRPDTKYKVWSDFRFEDIPGGNPAAWLSYPATPSEQTAQQRETGETLISAAHFTSGDGM